MDNDDQPIGRLLTRREMLKLLTMVGADVAAVQLLIDLSLIHI